MNIWLNAIGYQAVWFCAVIGAGRGLWWPGVVAAVVFVGWQWATSPQRGTDARVVLLALVCGCIVDTVLQDSGFAHYAAGWPSSAFAPAWILAVWASFAMTLTQSMRFLQSRWWLPLALGVIGGPMAYSAASRGWGAVVFAEPHWHAIALLAVCWAIALPALARVAARGMRKKRLLRAPDRTGSRHRETLR